MRSRPKTIPGLLVRLGLLRKWAALASAASLATLSIGLAMLSETPIEATATALELASVNGELQALLHDDERVVLLRLDDEGGILERRTVATGAIVDAHLDDHGSVVWADAHGVHRQGRGRISAERALAVRALDGGAAWVADERFHPVRVERGSTTETVGYLWDAWPQIGAVNDTVAWSRSDEFEGTRSTGIFIANRDGVAELVGADHRLLGGAAVGLAERGGRYFAAWGNRGGLRYCEFRWGSECDPRAASDRGVWDVHVATRHGADAIVWLDYEDWVRALIVHRDGRARVTTLGRGRSPTVAPTRHGFAIAWLDRGRLSVTVLPSADLA